MPLDSTVAGVSSNSYVSLDYAEDYFEDRLYTTTWSAATDDNKERALIGATRILEYKVRWYGLKNSEEQALAWPRSNIYDIHGELIDSTVVPDELKYATCDLAQDLLVSNRLDDDSADGLDEIEVGPLRLKYKDSRSKRNVIPDEVLEQIRHLGKVMTRGGNISVPAYRS